MPLKRCKNKDGVSGWSWGNGGCIVGKDAKKKAIKVGLAVDGPENFKKEMGKAENHFDQEVLTIAKRELELYETAQAKVVRADDGWRVLGQSKVFPTIDEAINWQYNGAEEVEDGPLVNTKRKGKPSKENFFASIKDAFGEKAKAELDQLEALYANVSKKERDSTPKEDFADPEHSKYPISTKDHLKSAIKLYGRSKDSPPETVKRNIIKIAKRKGDDWVKLLPDDWK